MNNEDKKQKQSTRQIYSNNWFILKLSFGSAPLFMCYMMFEAIKQQALVFLEHTYGINYVLEAAEYHKPFIVVVRFLAIVLASWATSFVFSGIYQNIVSQKGLPKITKKLKDMMYEKARELDLECYDNPEYYNEFVLSLSEAEKSITRTHEIIQAICTGITILITSGIFFLTVDSPSVIFVFISFLLTFLFTQYMNKINFKNRLEKNPPERKRSYVHRVFYLNEYAKEVRLNPEISDRLYEEFENTNEEIWNIENKYAKKRSILQFVVNYVTNDFISDVVYITYLVYRAAVAHVISYSNVVVLWNSSGSLKSSLRIIARIFPQISENSLYIDKIRNFLNYEKKINSVKNLPVPDTLETLEFKNVSFGYTEKDGYILR
ncbi:MAG TPA: ABC transporter ATP-binding protein, partial [Mobilitalea sp.]|nr:ABC transporter ATP-binding protein [Mobilitalea sp.]